MCSFFKHPCIFHWVLWTIKLRFITFIYMPLLIILPTNHAWLWIDLTTKGDESKTYSLTSTADKLHLTLTRAAVGRQRSTSCALLIIVMMKTHGNNLSAVVWCLAAWFVSKKQQNSGCCCLVDFLVSLFVFYYFPAAEHCPLVEKDKSNIIFIIGPSHAFPVITCP